MCEDGEACSIGRLVRGRCASSLDRSAGAETSERKRRTDQIWDEEKDVLLWLLSRWNRGLYSCAIAVGAAPYCCHCDVPSVSVGGVGLFSFPAFASNVT
jgi:hypothetical protein